MEGDRRCIQHVRKLQIGASGCVVLSVHSKHSRSVGKSSRGPRTTQAPVGVCWPCFETVMTVPLERPICRRFPRPKITLLSGACERVHDDRHENKCSTIHLSVSKPGDPASGVCRYVGDFENWKVPRCSRSGNGASSTSIPRPGSWDHRGSPSTAVAARPPAVRAGEGPAGFCPG